MIFRPTLLIAFLVTAVSSEDPTTTVDNVQGTPDNLPPSQETICDRYAGKAQGLCVAYCEAKDCDTHGVDSNPSCMKIKENFLKITGETSMPCERCPCWDWGELDRITNENVFSDPSYYFRSCKMIGDYIHLLFSDEYVDQVFYRGLLRDSRGYGVHSGRCISLFDYGTNWFSHTWPEPLDADLYNICANDIANRCAELGF